MGVLAGVGGYVLGSDESESESAEATTAGDGDLPIGWRLCTNERLGYALGYPIDWSAPALSAESECTFFDPQATQLPESGDVLGPALEVAAAQNSYARVVGGLVDPRLWETLERRDVTVAGRPAVAVVARATGDNPLVPGTDSATYVIDRGSEPPLVLRTISRPHVNWEERLRIIDEAARSIVLFEPQHPDGEEAPPDAVVRKRAAMLAAAEAGDYDALAELADPTAFEYTFGGPVAGGPATYWRREEARGADPTPAEALAAILRMPYTLSRGLYVWPFAYDKTADELTEYERTLLEPLGDAGAFADGYLGRRAGIRPDGRWVFFVAGD